jgi:uncharacterized cysteine cluster protein YcgN (CxxCxxCC family)
MFWKEKSLSEMSPEEWESLCDGCAICCLEKIEDKATGKICLTSIACRYLDVIQCRCTVYDDRLKRNPRCIKLSLDNVHRTPWLPGTCAYRRLAENKDLQWWHPLVSGDVMSVHESGVSVQDKVLSGKFIHPDEALVGEVEK